MPAQHVNFYENLKEAQMRLRSTYVMYDREPYHVVAITNHRPGGVFSIYLDPLDYEGTAAVERSFPNVDSYNQESNDLGKYLDDWMEVPAVKKYSRMIRKNMDSTYFNKFRPFPLGMCNFKGRVSYLERSPQRHREQGLTRAMVVEHVVSADPGPKTGRVSVEMHSKGFRDCVVADHPSFSDCLKNLQDPEIENVAAAFDRNFALVRGPCDIIFLAYKQDIIGVLPNGDQSVVRLAKAFTHTREVVESIGLFQSIK